MSRPLCCDYILPLHSSQLLGILASLPIILADASVTEEFNPKLRPHHHHLPYTYSWPTGGSFAYMSSLSQKGCLLLIFQISAQQPYLREAGADNLINVKPIPFYYLMLLTLIKGNASLSLSIRELDCPACHGIARAPHIPGTKCSTNVYTSQ